MHIVHCREQKRSTKDSNLKKTIGLCHFKSYYSTVQYDGRDRCRIWKAKKGCNQIFCIFFELLFCYLESSSQPPRVLRMNPSRNSFTDLHSNVWDSFFTKLLTVFWICIILLRIRIKCYISLQIHIQFYEERKKTFPYILYFYI